MLRMLNRRVKLRCRICVPELLARKLFRLSALCFPGIVPSEGFRRPWNISLPVLDKKYGSKADKEGWMFGVCLNGRFLFPVRSVVR